MDRKITNKICNELANVCKMLAKREKDKKQKEVFLNKAKVFRGLAKIKTGSK